MQDELCLAILRPTGPPSTRFENGVTGKRLAPR